MILVLIDKLQKELMIMDTPKHKDFHKLLNMEKIKLVKINNIQKELILRKENIVNLIIIQKPLNKKMVLLTVKI